MPHEGLDPRGGSIWIFRRDDAESPLRQRRDGDALLLLATEMATASLRPLVPDAGPAVAINRDIEDPVFLARSAADTPAACHKTGHKSTALELRTRFAHTVITVIITVPSVSFGYACATRLTNTAYA
jgi:hypothetical protein